MNKIQAKIAKITKNNACAFIKLESLHSNAVFSALMLDFSDNLMLGQSCKVVFKESEVMIADKDYVKISARNRFVSPICAIESDEIFARIYLAFENGKITSLITKEALEALDLKRGDEVAWFVKSNEVMIEF